MPNKFEYDYNDAPLQPPNADTQIGWAGVPLSQTCGYAGVTPRAKMPTNDVLGFDPPYEAADPLLVAEHWLNLFNSALNTNDVDSIMDIIYEDGWWRDVGLLTWDIRSLRGKEIKTMLAERLAKTGIKNVALIPSVPPTLEVMGDDLCFVSFHYKFDCTVGRGSGFARLSPTHAKQDQALAPELWQAFNVSTTLDSLTQFPPKTGRNVPLESKLVDPRGEARTYRQQRADEVEYKYEQPTVIIVGAGHCGLGMAARLKVYGISCLVLDHNTAPGSSWSNRYASLSLHNPAGANHLPYIPYPDHYPLYIPAQQLGSFLETYAKMMDLNVWTESKVLPGAKFDEKTKTWSVQISRKGQIRAMSPKYIIIATGVSGTLPAVPKSRGMDEFKGQIYHSSTFRTGSDWAGKRVLVVGAATSAHDIAWELYDNKCEPTLLQRNSTHVFSVDRGVPLAYAKYMPEVPGSLEDKDRESWLAASFPVSYELAPRLFKAIKGVDAELLDSLKKVGFRLNDGFHGTGALALTNYKIGGYFFDTGCCGLVAQGKVKLTHSEIDHYTPSGVVFKDGTASDFDVVVYANGYYDTIGPIRSVLGDYYADKVNEKVEKGNGFMIDAEGEARMQFRELPQEGLYNAFQQFAFCRFHSLRLALKIVARENGIDTTPYGNFLPEPASFEEGQRPRVS